MTLWPDSGHERCTCGDSTGNGTLDGKSPRVHQIFQSKSISLSGAIYLINDELKLQILKMQFKDKKEKLMLIREQKTMEREATSLRQFLGN